MLPYYSAALLLLFVCSYQVLVSSISCLDENGKPVDSWTAIKGSNDFNYYVYNEDTETWDLSPYFLNQTEGTDGCIMGTVGALYGAASNGATYDMLGLYNDEQPNGNDASSTYAHAKGILVASVASSSGYWLVHSMPLWPEYVDDAHDFPGPFPSDTYAQSLRCVSINAETADVLAANLMISRPYIYSTYITENTTIQEDILPNMYSWLSGNKNGAVDSNITTFKSVGGNEFVQFEKSKYWGKDLWDDLVAPYYTSPMNVETWRSGSGGRMSSICGNGPKQDEEEYDVYMVSTVSMPQSAGGDSWGGNQDHSKWGSTTNSDVYASCVGDINRMCSQETRGGGALCSDDEGMWKAFDSIISSVESCYEYDPCYPNGTSTQCYWCPTASPTPSP